MKTVPDKDDMEVQETDKPAQRLCSEIQLFDLCDLERCNHKQGRFCTNGELLTRFERISEMDDTRPVSDSYLSEDEEEADEEPDGLDDDDRADWEDE